MQKRGSVVHLERWIPAYKEWYEGTMNLELSREYPKCVGARVIDYLEDLEKQAARCVICGNCNGELPDLLLATKDAYYHSTCTKIENKHRSGH